MRIEQRDWKKNLRQPQVFHPEGLDYRVGENQREEWERKADHEFQFGHGVSQKQ